MKAFLKRLRFALEGWGQFFPTEKNGQIQTVIALLVVIAGIFFQLTLVEWALIIICIGAVLALEMVNSALEIFCNRVHPDWHSDIKKVKDIAAGAVLWISVASVVVGCLIFIPKIKSFFF